MIGVGDAADYLARGVPCHRLCQTPTGVIMQRHAGAVGTLDARELLILVVSKAEAP